MRCRTCNSHNPKLHPAVQDGGEVSVCPDAFHATAAALEKAAQVCEAQEATFLAPEYAAEQPLSSFQERFACRQCAAAIRAEIERCANVAEDQRADDWFEVGRVVVATGKRIAGDIRALGGTKPAKAGTMTGEEAAVRAAIAKTEYKYFGDYEMSDDQRDAVDVLVATAHQWLELAASLEHSGNVPATPFDLTALLRRRFELF